MSTYGYLAHHGVKGQKWGIRRYQNADGSLTAEGQKRYYNEDGSISRIGKKIEINNWKSDLKKNINDLKQSKKDNKAKLKEGSITRESYRNNKYKIRNDILNKKRDLEVAKGAFITKDQKMRLKSLTKNTEGRRRYRTGLLVQNAVASYATQYAAAYVAKKAAKVALNYALDKLSQEPVPKTYGSYREIDDFSEHFYPAVIDK